MDSAFWISFFSWTFPSIGKASHCSYFNSSFAFGLIKIPSNSSIIFSGLFNSNKFISLTFSIWFLFSPSLIFPSSKILFVFCSLFSGKSIPFINKYSTCLISKGNFFLGGIYKLSLVSICWIGTDIFNISNLSTICARFSGYFIFSIRILSTNFISNFSFSLGGIKMLSLFSIIFLFSTFLILFKISNFPTFSILLLSFCKDSKQILSTVISLFSNVFLFPKIIIFSFGDST